MKKFLACLAIIGCASPALAFNQGDAYTTVLGFTPGKTTLQEIEKKLGKAELKETGEYATYEGRICYTSDTQAVTFISKEIGGIKDLTGFEVSQPTPQQLAECSKLPAEYNKPIKVGKLELGQTKKQANAELQGKAAKNQQIARQFKSVKSGSPKDLQDLEPAAGGAWNYLVNVKASLRKDQVNKIQVMRTDID